MKKNVTLIVSIILLSYFSISWSNKYSNDLNVEVLSDEDISQNNFLNKQKTKSIFETAVNASSLPILSQAAYENIVNTNLAINGTSTAINEAYGSSDLAHDDNTARDYSSGSVFVASSADEAWWNIDLGDTYIVDSIRIYSRNDYEDDLVNFYVLGDSSTSFTGNLASNLSEADFSYYHGSSPIIDPSLLVDVGGECLRYVRIRKTSDWSDLALAEVEIYGRPDNDPIEAPTDLEATAISDTQINLKWTDNSDNEDGFIIERSQTNSNYDSIDIVVENDTTYQDNGLSYNTTYYYRVKAFNAQTESAYSNVDTATTNPDPDPIMTGTKRDLLHDQNAWIHENSIVGDYVTIINFNPDSLRFSAIPYISTIDSFYIYKDESILFDNIGDIITIGDPTGLITSSDYEVTVAVQAQSLDGSVWDTALINIRCIDEDSIIYIANGEGGAGTYSSPLGSIPSTLNSNTYYFVERGSEFGTISTTVNFSENSRMMSYGQGSKPLIRMSNGDADDYCVYISSTDDGAVIHGIDFRFVDDPSRGIQITQANDVEISSCRLDSAYVNIWSDINMSAKGTCNNLRIYDNQLYESGEDPVHLEMEFSYVVGNEIMNLGRVDPHGDGMHLTQTHEVYFANNYIYMGEDSTDKSLLLFRADYISGEQYPPWGADLGNSVIEHNVFIGNSTSHGGINFMGYGGIARYNNVKRTLDGTVYNYANGLSAYEGDSCVFHHNVVENFTRGISVSYNDNKVFNNTIVNCDIGFYTNSEMGSTSAQFYNNVISGVDYY